MRKIIPEDLSDACEEQRELFATMYPDGVKVTEEECVKVKDVLDLCWAARNLLDPEQWDEYERIRSAAMDVYHEATQPTCDAYWKAREPHDDARSEAWNAVHTQWCDACDLLRDKHQECEPGPDWQAYEAECGRLYQEAKKAFQPQEDAHSAVVIPLSEANRLFCQPFWDTYTETRARAFAIAWNS